MYEYVLLIVGLVLLVIGGDFLVRGAVGLAEKLGIPALVIGLTVVAFGTSAPELFISVQAALSGASGIAIGNVVGSNIANVLLVMGLPALIAASRCDDKGIGRNIMVMIGFSIIFILMLVDGIVTRFEGIVLLMLLSLFLFDQVRLARKSAAENGENPLDYTEEISSIPASNLAIFGFLIFGLVSLPFGADLTVDSATAIAKRWNVSDAVIGLTIVAIGTSLPELATAVMATIRGSTALAIGNVVGSNIFNIGSIMGVAATISPMQDNSRILQVDAWVMLVCALIIAVLAHWKVKIGKRVGVAMLLAYTIYLASAFYF